MRVLHYTHPNYLPKLSDELIAGVPSVAPIEIDGVRTAVMTVASVGSEITLTVPDDADEPAIAAVVASHDPTPPPRVVEFAGEQQVSAIVRTTGAAPLTVFTFPCEQKRLYQASLTISGVDAVSGASKLMEGRFVWKRPAAVTVMVGLTVISDIHDAAAASWSPNAVPSGTTMVFTVAGAAGRTIDWLLHGQVDVYAPGGLEG